jgi:hypothetical protein
MTTIRKTSDPEAGSGVGARSELCVRLLSAVIAAGCLVAAGLFATESVSYLGETRGVLSTMLIKRMDALRPGFSCDLFGRAIQGGPVNCLDYRGFRVRREDGYRVYSMRYSKPMFVFGIQRGLFFQNQKIDHVLQLAEQSAFAAYFTR